MEWFIYIFYPLQHNAGVWNNVLVSLNCEMFQEEDISQCWLKKQQFMYISFINQNYFLQSRDKIQRRTRQGVSVMVYLLELQSAVTTGPHAGVFILSTETRGRKTLVG